MYNSCENNKTLPLCDFQLSQSSASNNSLPILMGASHHGTATDATPCSRLCPDPIFGSLATALGPSDAWTTICYSTATCTSLIAEVVAGLSLPEESDETNGPDIGKMWPLSFFLGRLRTNHDYLNIGALMDLCFILQLCLCGAVTQDVAFFAG
ncbi:hypothetical protein C8R43DRAFT_198886 [Mycena crocata]|nr:hypothetical protein C8R43DRAFT_198886 [Mycena crocata]